jgi:hypothetical protein
MIKFEVMTYRKLFPQEVERLTAQGCCSEDWDLVQISDQAASSGDSFSFIYNVSFSGEVKFGIFEKTFKLPGGVLKHSGMKGVTLHNVTVGDNCYIENVSNYIANYEIGCDTIIENVDVIMVDGKSCFGNGVKVSVMNETGGREVMINDKLSAHIAYIMAMYRHRPKLIEHLQDIAEFYANKHASSVGTIGHDVIIRNTGSIANVRIGDCCTIIGAGRLQNGSINSNESAPVQIGYGVVAEDFIISSGSVVEDNTAITRCFIGQACQLGHGYSASDSLFFCNCQGENGEACAIFAGPFTVTHHKSTLLIAGMFSFMNAGSGSNQSNHMYKLGPIHQGTLERGAKTASDSYILWPSRVGAFSLVMGRHVTHSDTSNLPFSYLIEDNNTTFLVPGVNLRSVGTVRDAQKWPKRDRRTDPHKLDYVNYNLLSPYTIQKMLKGLRLLGNLQYASGLLSDVYAYHSTKIRNSSLKKGIELYRTAITKFLGNSIIKRLEGLSFENDEDIRRRLVPDTFIGRGDWADLSGLIAPKSEIDALLDGIEAGSINKLKDINAEFERMHQNYYTYEWTWAYGKIEEFFGIDPALMTAADVVTIVKKWEDAVIGLDYMLYEDAKKEFSLASMTGFGADGTKDDKEQDFEQVRGDFESNAFVTAVLQHIQVKKALGDELIERLSKV